MKALLALLVVLCSAACVERGGDGARVKMVGAPELRFHGGYAITVTDSALHATYKGRAISYEEGSLYVDGKLMTLPTQVRVVAFDGPDIYVDGRRSE